MKNKLRRPVLELIEVGTNHAHLVIHKSDLKKFEYYEFQIYTWNSSSQEWALVNTQKIPNSGLGEMPHSVLDLKSGEKYLFRVRARKDKSKLSKGLAISTHRKPGSSKPIPTGLGVQFNNSDSSGKSLMTVEVNGQKQLCKLNSDHQFNVIKMANDDYEQLVSQHPRFSTPKTHPNPYNPECQYTLVKGRRYNVAVKDENGDIDQVMRTLIYLGAHSLSGSRGGTVCSDGGGAKQNGRISIPHYYMIRYWSNTDDMEDSAIPKCTNSMLEKHGAKGLLDYPLAK